MRRLTSLMVVFILTAFLGAPAWAEEKAADQKPAASLEEGFAKLAGDTTKLKIGLWFKGGWFNDTQANPGNQFYVRNARPYFYGQLADKLGWRVSVDFSTTAANPVTLRDAFIWADYIPYNRVVLGQFLVPFTVESTQTWEVHMVNNSMVVNYVQIPTARDLGIMVNGKYETPVGDGKLGAGYDLAYVNGTGTNNTDNNSEKDFVARLWTTPVINGLKVGGSMVLGKGRTSATDITEKTRNRYGLYAEYLPTNNILKGLRVKGEYIQDKRWVTTTSFKNRFAHAYGWYATVWYKVDGLEGPFSVLNGVEPLVRYDFLDEAKEVKENDRNRTTVGVNYYFNKYSRLKLNYEFTHCDTALAKNSLAAADTVSHQVFTTEFEIWF